ncbi:MAG: transposase [Pirellulales bacterium]
MSELATARRSRQGGDTRRLTVAEILREHASGFVAKHSRQAAPQVRSTLAKLSLCRTAAMGGRTLRCPSCDHRCAVYNSCGDRHCPKCGGARRSEWLDSTSPLLLPEVDYFQVVFTLPEALSALALGNRRAVYDLLFAAAWQALREVLEERFGIQPAALMVLHTWNQRLEAHAHVHALVPGGGPSRCGRHWIKTRHPRHRRRRKPYLVDNHLLSERFRAKFLAGLERLHHQGKLQLGGELAGCVEQFTALLDGLRSRPWVVYIEAPPSENASPEHVVKYLARYMTGGPISDRRLVAHARGKVTFLARSTEKSKGGGAARLVPVTLSGVEFTRRWSLHILPKGYTKVRRYGGYSNRRRTTYLHCCRKLLRLAPLSTDARPETPSRADGDSSAPRCPKCSAAMTCLADTARSSWAVVMTGPDRPVWYRDD